MPCVLLVFCSSRWYCSALIACSSSAKMLQALPLITSGAAHAHGLTSEQLALACASHEGGEIHTSRVRRWIDDLGLSDYDFRCGAHMPWDKAAHKALLCSDTAPCQLHNNCSGKHAGFLTLNRQLGGGPDYVEPDHPVQKAVFEAFEEITAERCIPEGSRAPSLRLRVSHNRHVTSPN